MTLDDLARTLVATDARTVLIDGRSGAGKSTMADVLQRLWRSSLVIRLDDIYPGWDGLAWAGEHIRTSLLSPRAEGRLGRWRQWDWVAGAPAGWHDVPADQRLIVEGVGALSAASRGLADIGIWVDAADDVRKERALRRDGDLFRPHWDRWAAQEDVAIARHRPRSVADYRARESADGPTWTLSSARTDDAPA